MSIKSLETLETWKKSKEFSLRIYREVLPLLPSEEKWNLNQQLRRLSLSVPANIAEGYGRFRINEYKQFLRISLGSGAELITQLIIASRLKYAEDSRCNRLVDEIEQIGKMTMSLIKKLEQSNGR